MENVRQMLDDFESTSLHNIFILKVLLWKTRPYFESDVRHLLDSIRRTGLL